MKGKWIFIATWILRVSMFLVYVLAGSGKFDSESYIAENFVRWDLGIYIMYVVGCFEVLGGVFLLFRKTLMYGCLMLMSIMLGAMVIHFINFEELGFPLLNIVLISLLSLTIYLSKKNEPIQ